MRKKRIIILSLVLHICLCACGDDAPTEMSSFEEATGYVDTGSVSAESVNTGNIFNTTEEELAKEFGEEIILSVARMHEAQNAWYDKMVADINEITGMDIVWEWNDKKTYYTQVEEKYATGEVADILFVRKSEGFLQAAEAGLFWDLGPYLDEYENLKMIPEAMRVAGSYNGKMYAIPTTRLNGIGLIYRLDWLQKLGLKEPTDWESFCDMLYAFTFNDPDGNGVDDTVGLYLNNSDKVWDLMECWFGVPNVWGLGADGNLIHKTQTSEYRQAYSAFCTLYEKGLINNGSNGVPAFSENSETSTVYQGGFYKGLGGSTIDSLVQASSVHRSLVEEGLIGEDEIIYASLACIDTGMGALCYPPDMSRDSMIAISTCRIKTEEQLRQVLQVLDRLHGTECVDLISHGWEGLNYAVDEENNYMVLNCDDQRSIISAYSGFGGVLLESLVDENSRVVEQYAKGNLIDWMDICIEHADDFVPDYASQYKSETYEEKGTELDAFLFDAEIRYITEEIDEAGFEAALAEWWAQGGEAITREVNEKYRAAQAAGFRYE